MATIFITGGSSGIGNALAVQLLAKEHQVLTCSRRLADNLPFEAQIALDVTDFAALRQLPEAIKERAENVDVLINNAGISLLASIADASEEDFDRVIATNLKAPFFLIQHLARAFNLSLIINVSSEASKNPYEAYGAYAVSKAGLNMLSRVCELEYPHIRTNTLILGDVATPIWEAEDFESLIERNPLGRLATYEDVLHAVEFLMDSPVTGVELGVTGGI